MVSAQQSISLTIVIVDQQGRFIPDLPVTVSSVTPKQQAGNAQATPFSVKGKTDASGELTVELPGPGAYYVYVEPQQFLVNLTATTKQHERVVFIWTGQTQPYNPMDWPGTIGFAKSRLEANMPLVILGVVTLTIIFLLSRDQRLRRGGSKVRKS